MNSDMQDRPGIDFILIPEGSFLMGGDTEPDHQPVHEVTISAFKLSRTHITNALSTRPSVRRLKGRIRSSGNRSAITPGPTFRTTPWSV